MVIMTKEIYYSGQTLYGASDIWTIIGVTDRLIHITNGLHDPFITYEEAETDYTVIEA